MKKLFFLVLILPLLSGNFVFAQSEFAQSEQDKIEIVFFWSQGCPHCATGKIFLAGLQERYPEIEIKQYEFSKNIELAKELYQTYGVSSRKQGLVPLTFTPERYFVGFSEQVGKEIERCIEECLGETAISTGRGREIKIPILGEINVEDFSIPALAVILGTLDGFNICSLGALVLILGLVFTLKSKRKILIFGGIFILTTVFVYGLLIFLWHQLFVFLAPFIKRMELLIGFLALVGAIYFFREFLKSKRGAAVCQFSGISEKLSKKIQKIFEGKTGVLTLIGAIFLFAAIVTIIEFPCTAFFPVLFAGILAESNIPLSLAVIYIGLYALFYMIDEIIVLFIAVFTMKVWIASPKFVTILNLLASILLFLLGLYYFF